MAPALHINSILRPSHVHLGLHDSEHRPSLRSVIEYLNDLSKTSDKDIHSGHPHAQQSSGIGFPRFDVRETVDAFFLEGEFPGIGDRNKISIERLGEQGLLIEADSSKLDIEQEWGMIAEWQESDNDTLTRPHSVEQSEDIEAQLFPAGPQSALETETGVDAPKADLPSTELWGEKQMNEKKKNPSKGLLSERETGSLQRSFTFPVPVDCSRLRARLKDGLLKVRVPKATAAHQRETFHIDVEH